MSTDKSSNGDGIKKIIQDPKFAGKLILKDMLPIKMSTVLLDFAKPLLDKTDFSNKRAAEKTIQKAVEVWNYSIVLDRVCANSGAEENRLYRLAMAAMIKNKLSFRISQSDYKSLLERKESLYPDYNHFIIEHNVRWSDGGNQMHLAVVTGDANKVQL